MGLPDLKTSTFEKLPEKRQIEILDASARVFAEKGYFQAGIAEICQAAGISNGALYKYFQNKQGIYIAVAQRTLALLQEQGRHLETKNQSIWDILRIALEAVLPFTEKYRDYLVVYLDLGSPSMEEFALELSNEFEKWSFDLFCSIAENAQLRGEIRKDISIGDISYFLDNHLLLLGFSCVSEHYARRFNQFLGKGMGHLSNEEKIELVMASFRQFLG